MLLVTHVQARLLVIILRRFRRHPTFQEGLAICTLPGSAVTVMLKDEVSLPFPHNCFDAYDFTAGLGNGEGRNEYGTNDIRYPAINERSILEGSMQGAISFSWI
jgi:hypothetical protein